MIPWRWVLGKEEAKICDCALDCIGFSAGMKARFARRCPVPVILPRSLLGKATAELAAQ
jgi:hypothetical protein